MFSVKQREGRTWVGRIMAQAIRSGGVVTFPLQSGLYTYSVELLLHQGRLRGEESNGISIHVELPTHMYERDPTVAACAVASGFWKVRARGCESAQAAFAPLLTRPHQMGCNDPDCNNAECDDVSVAHHNRSVMAFSKMVGFTWGDEGSLELIEQADVDVIVAHFECLGMLRPCTVCLANFSLDGGAACFSCAMAQLLKPLPTEAAPPPDCCSICLEPVLNSDVTLCCDKAMHRVCATGVRPLKHGVRACPLCCSQTFCILQTPTTAPTA